MVQTHLMPPFFLFYLTRMAFSSSHSGQKSINPLCAMLTEDIYKCASSSSHDCVPKHYFSHTFTHLLTRGCSPKCPGRRDGETAGDEC